LFFFHLNSLELVTPVDSKRRAEIWKKNRRALVQLLFVFVLPRILFHLF